MTSKEIRDLAPTEITTKLRETRDQLLQLRLRKNTGQVEKPHLLREYRKSMKGSRAGNAKRGNTLAFGEFGLQSLSRGPMTGQQIEAARVTIARHLKRKGKLWIRIFPHKPVTKKPAEVRMGQGKGPVEFYVAVIKPGAVLFELAGVSATIAKEAFRLADAKLPFRCRFIVREGTAV